MVRFECYKSHHELDDVEDIKLAAAVVSFKITQVLLYKSPSVVDALVRDLG